MGVTRRSAGSASTHLGFRESGSIRVDQDIASLTIKGSLIGKMNNPVVISARGQVAPVGASELAIGSLTVNGRVEYANILVGFRPIGTDFTADTHIAPVIVGQDWIASSLVAGAVPVSTCSMAPRTTEKLSSPAEET